MPRDGALILSNVRRPTLAQDLFCTVTRRQPFAAARSTAQSSAVLGRLTGVSSATIRSCSSRMMYVAGAGANGRNSALGMQTLKRIAQPDDIGGVVAFLVSEEARWITGDIIHVDGGSKL